VSAALTLVLALLAGALVTSSSVDAAVGPDRGSAVPAPAAMPGPLMSEQTFDFWLTGPNEIIVGGNGDAWFTMDRRRVGRMTPGGSFHVTAGVSAELLAPAPDDGIWAVDEIYGTIARVAADGTVTFPDLVGAPVAPATGLGQPAMAGDGRPVAATGDLDGNLWYTVSGTESDAGAVVRVTPAGAVTAFAGPDIWSPTAITSGAGGDVWFSDTQRLGRISPAGVVSFSDAGTYVERGHLAVGPDGNLWISEGNRIVRVTPTGTSTTFSVLGLWTGPIVAGADGKLWFRSSGPSQLGSITTSGVVTLFSDTGFGREGALAAGADGLWIADRSNGAVARVGHDGSVTDVPSPNIGTIAGIATGPDGNVWVTSPSTDTIGRITQDGVLTVFEGADEPNGITAGSDGNLWFTSTGADTVGHITPTGAVTTITDPGIDGPTAIALGGDGNVWFVNDGNGTVGRVTPSGSVAAFPASGLDQLAAGPNDLTVGPDGSLWFTSAADNRVGRMTTSGSVGWYADDDIETPTLIAIDPHGGVYVANRPAGKVPSIARVEADGTATTIVTPVLPVTFTELEAGSDGNIWFSGGRVAPDGTISNSVPWYSRFSSPVTVGPEGAMWSGGSSSIVRVKVVETGAPLFPRAVPGKERAEVSWRPPTTPIDGPVTGYVATATPGGRTCSTAGALSCTITGLEADVAHTVSIRAISGSGSGAASLAPGFVTPWSGSGYHPLSPDRILDSRRTDEGFRGRVVANAPRSLQVAGLGGASNVPASASAVVMNVTATDSTAESFLTVYPTGTTAPKASNLNFGTGQVIPNLVTVKLGAGGKVDIATAVGSTHVVADVVGYYDDGTATGDLFTPLRPVRLHDSRWSGTKLTAGTPKDVLIEEPIYSTFVPPASASAVVVNITVTEGDAQSFVTAWPKGEAQPGVSNLNFLPGQTIANLAVVKLSADGSIRLANTVGSVHVIVDVVAYFDPTHGSRFHPIDANRILDTRTGTGLAGMQGPGQTRSLAVGGAAGSGAPIDATGMVANVTVADATAESFVSVWPPDPLSGSTNSSNLNFGTNQVIPNLVMSGLAANGTVNFSNHLGETHLIADLVGWYARY